MLSKSQNLIYTLLKKLCFNCFHFYNFKKKTTKNIDMAQNSTQITGITFFRTKGREKVTSN